MIRIQFDYGTRQTFRRRTRDITVRGCVDNLPGPVSHAAFRLNGGEERPLYVEQIEDDCVDWLNGYKPTPAELRCRHLGEFCIEIPANDGALDKMNQVALTVESEGETAAEELSFAWNVVPPSLPLDLRDLRNYSHIQEIGQAVNGIFDLDRDQNLIRSRGPVAPDALLVIGPFSGSQEAKYCVRFLEPPHSKWLGLSDYFAGLEPGVPDRGIKVGWSSAGMAVVTPNNQARSFIAWGDHSGHDSEWAVATNPPANVQIRRGQLYHVRHQLIFKDGFNVVRFRIWPDGQTEPVDWLCHESDRGVPRDLPRHSGGSFGLFQHMGMPIEWSNISLSELDPAGLGNEVVYPERAPFLGRNRPGAF